MAKGVSTMHHGEDWGPSLIGVTVTMLVLSIIAVTARIYTSVVLIKRFVLEDGLAIATTFVYFVFTLFCCLGVHWGLGKPTMDVPRNQHHMALLFKYLGMASYVAVSGLIKFVVGIYLIRLFKNSRQKWQTWLLTALLVLVCLANTLYFFISIFQCQPVWRYWRQKDEDFNGEGQCFKPPVALGVTYTVNLINIVTDLVLALLPISLVWGAQLDRRTKISVVVILAMGSASSLATIIRVPYLYQLLDNPEYLANFVELANWSAIEIGLAIIASSAATLRPLFRKFKLLSTVARSRNTPYGQGYANGSRSRKSTFHSRSRSFGFHKTDGKDTTPTTGTSTMFSVNDVKGPITVDTSITIDVEKGSMPTSKHGRNNSIVTWRDDPSVSPVQTEAARERDGSQDRLAGSWRTQRRREDWDVAPVEGGRSPGSTADHEAFPARGRREIRIRPPPAAAGVAAAPFTAVAPAPSHSPAPHEFYYRHSKPQRVTSMPALPHYTSSTELPDLESPVFASPVMPATPPLPPPSPYPLSPASTLSSAIPTPVSPMSRRAASPRLPIPPAPAAVAGGRPARDGTPFI